jgi:EAL domain-containing protein (putative c-di-GMP-specific phosphodiesterase class I)/GGDEF domain-containing protein
MSEQDQKLDWLLPAVEAVSAIMSSAAPLENKLKSACSASVEHSGACAAWILLGEGRNLANSAADVSDRALSEVMANRGQASMLMRRLVDASARAIRDSVPVVVRGVGLPGLHRDMFAAPLTSSGRFCGLMVCLFESEPERSDQELESLQVVARMIAVGISAISTATGLPNTKDSHGRMDSLVSALPGSVLVADPSGAITHVMNGHGSALPYKKIDNRNWTLDFANSHFAESHSIAMNKALGGSLSRCHVHVPNGDETTIIEETLSPVVSPAGNVVEVVGFARDVTEQLHLRETIRELREKDRITGCFTMQALRERARAEAQLAREKGHQLAFFSIEIDKSGTGTHLVSQDAFEDLLRNVANRIARCFPKLHTMARRSEQSFVVVCRVEQGRQTAMRIAESIISTLREPVLTGRHDHFLQEHFLSASTGFAVFPEDANTSDEGFTHADIAALHAQRSGRNRACAFTRDIASEASDRLMIESRLHRAVDNEEFSLAFQPKVSLANGEVCGVEALIRWNGQHGASPGKFIPIAEECGLIAFIGEWVLRQACQTAKRWYDHGLKIPVSVNVSTRQFHDNDFHNIVREILHESGCPPSLLELEVTEGVMFEDPKSAIKSFSFLRNMGVSVSIDDFGMGFSSLSYLKNLPVDALKIDRTFINGLPGDGDNAAITRAIIGMSRAMDLKVVAEGVEELDCLRFLKGADCDMVQGFYFSQPLFEEDFVNWLKAYQSIAMAA